MTVQVTEHDQEDGEQDEIASTLDNCPDAANAGQADTDNDGVGDGARNRGGSGPTGTSVTVSLDTSLPGSPTNLAATAKSEGLLRLSWQAGSSASVKGYNLYRANHTTGQLR